MFLSNPRLFLLVTLFCVAFFEGCGSAQPSANKDISLTGETGNEFPFSTREPEIYQGEFVVITGKNEDRSFLARKGDRWRMDIFRGGERWLTQLKTDKLYAIDHAKKTYAATPETANARDNGPNDMTANFFRGKEYREFDEIGREGDLIRYKVRETDASNTAVMITIDQKSGLMVRQEFRDSGADAGSPAAFVYEMRDLKLEVDDGIFSIPAGYRKVSWDEYRTQSRQNK